jgi:TetR/AcrR family hemagglutinin/protease transcriptional regulator
VAQKPIRRRLSPEERKIQLLGAAIDLFAEKGLGEAKHADIARRVGISTAATFVYFPTREALLESVVEEIGRFFLALFDNIKPNKGDASEILRFLAGSALAIEESHPNYIRVWLGWSTRFDDAMRSKYLDFQDKILSKISEILWASEENISRENRDDARILLSASQTISLMKLDGEPEDKIQRFTDHTIDVVLAFNKK